jgi:bifunctional DNA-binding transcriptional regulator/antitoxin component of YhaV-PrlF toxin-antitoxin module
MASRVSTRGQITIDRTVRRQLGIRPGMVAYQRVVGGHLEVIFLPETHSRSLYGIFHQQSDQPQAITIYELEEAVMEAIAAAQEQDRDDHA